eukprot:s1851_g12.t1
MIPEVALGVQGEVENVWVSVNEVGGKRDGGQCVEWSGNGSDGAVDEKVTDEIDAVVDYGVLIQNACLPHSGQVEENGWQHENGVVNESMEVELVSEWAEGDVRKPGQSLVVVRMTGEK